MKNEMKPYYRKVQLSSGSDHTQEKEWTIALIKKDGLYIVGWECVIPFDEVLQFGEVVDPFERHPTARDEFGDFTVKYL